MNLRELNLYPPAEEPKAVGGYTKKGDSDGECKLEWTVSIMADPRSPEADRHQDFETLEEAVIAFYAVVGYYVSIGEYVAFEGSLGINEAYWDTNTGRSYVATVGDNIILLSFTKGP
jgi:hypothetical protein